ncbi:hypothetical protein PybrP1_009497 [[Pythium] brassicae (nom. inval.)]|nr:hypothetical protein PybrP1_009497 [[Pythium] brassicae (nom. inval.)]
MTRQGYLMLHEKRARPRVLFFALEDGFFRFYECAARVKRLGEFKLSGCKLAVKAQKRADGVPYSFFLETRKVFVKDRSYTLGSPVRVELSASSNDDRQEWGKALFSWQRYYWRDPAASGEAEAPVVDDDAVKAQLELLVTKFFAKETGGSSCSLSFAAAKQPLSFIRRNAYSLRRSMSFSTTSAASTPSTASSSTSSNASSSATHPCNDAGNQHVALASKKRDGDAPHTTLPTDCEKDKVVLAKVSSYCDSRVAISSRSHRGNNQEFH